MKRINLIHWVVAAMVLGSPNVALPQALPTSQPKLIKIEREKLKYGVNADHARHEAGWPAAHEKAKSFVPYLALSSLSGPNEIWYVIFWGSHATEAKAMKKDENDPVLSGEFDRLARRDAEFVHSLDQIYAVGRPDLSVGAFPDLSKARFFEITVYSVRPGYEEQFDQCAKTLGAALKRGEPKVAFHIYQVIAGMPLPTYLVFTSLEDYAGFDAWLDPALWNVITEEEKTLLQKNSAAGLLKVENNRFRVDPSMSYVSKETREKDPAFWLPK